jgi:site-specific recombinase XerD
VPTTISSIGEEQNQHQQKQQQTSPYYRYEVTTGSLSQYTRYSYTHHINDFLAHFKITDIEPLKEYGPKVIKQMVKDYILHLRDNSSRRLARKSINVHLAAISHFLYMIRDDDYKIDWKKVRLEIPPDENIHKDRSYTIEEIQKMLSGCQRTRDKAIIHLLTSTGMRIGAVHTLKVEDLSPKQTNQGRVYRIEVYSGSSDSYYCYCNVETTQILDEYLKERTDAGEVLRNDSPLIRHLYTSISIKAPVKKVSDPQIKYIVGRIVKLSGIKNTFQYTGEAKRGKGFRKYYKTQAELAGMKPINVELTHGHSIGMSGHYYTPSESDVLNDYMTHAADALTVSQAHRQEKRIEELETERTEEIARLKTQIDKMKENHSEVLTLKAQFDEMRKKMDQIDLVDLQTFPEDYTIHNLLADYEIEEYNNNKPQKQDKVNPKRQKN